MEIRSFTFDDINSLDYGVYITGSGVYDAPERDVDVISIPGRNGDLYLDNGRFNNIDVTYPASMGRMSQNDFSNKMQEFRNALLSKTGYCRLYDDYNPDEFRLGVYKSGLNVSPNKQNRAGEFDITFNCKPQRYLKSGEQKVTVTSGDVIVNPTPFDASPLLEVEGYGNIVLGGQPVSIIGRDIGKVRLTNHIQVVTSPGADADVEASYYNIPHYSGDECVMHHVYRDYFSVQPNSKTSNYSATISSGDQVSASTGTTTVISWQPYATYFVYGYSGTITGSAEVVLNWYDFSAHASRTATVTITYNGVEYGNNKVVSYTTDVTISGTDASYVTHIRTERDVSPYIISTYSALGNPLYLDLETGNAWKYEDGELYSVNGVVWMGADLAVLNPGENEITYNSTIHDLKITPRWWQI